MFCTNCGANYLEPQANYCSHCGKKLGNNVTKNKMRFVLLLPLLSFILVIILLYSTNIYESNVNEKVIRLQEKAEKAALEGKYDKALAYIEEGLTYRNDYEVLKDEKDMIQRIVELNNNLSDVEKKMMNEDFTDAQNEIKLLKKQIDINQSPLYINLWHQVEEAETSVKVGEIKEEINQLTTIDDLADKLSTLYSLNIEEASELKQQIYTKMVMISSNEAEKYLEAKHYSQAVYVVDEALQYVVNNEKLLSLKDRIMAEKALFEKEEQARIEKAMQAAKVEEERNLTKAVHLSSIKLKVDKFGDAYIEGIVKNSGTETVHSIIVEFGVLDKSGKKIESGKTNVFPNKILPGDTGNFEHVTYAAKEGAKININNISWLLEKKKG